VHLQPITQLAQCCVRLRTHQVSQPLQVDLDEARSASGQGHGASGLAPDLLDASRPRRAHIKRHGNLLRRRATVIRRQHSISQILRVRLGHPWLLSTMIHMFK